MRLLRRRKAAAHHRSHNSKVPWRQIQFRELCCGLQAVQYQKGTSDTAGSQNVPQCAARPANHFRIFKIKTPKARYQRSFTGSGCILGAVFNKFDLFPRQHAPDLKNRFIFRGKTGTNI